MVIPSVTWRGPALLAAPPDAAFAEMEGKCEAWAVRSTDSDSSFEPEVQAIALALSCVPLEVSVDIRTDSAAACRAISAFPDLSERQKLRSPQRPFLRFIHAVRQLKAARGAHYTLTHVKAHTGREDRLSVGNACADLVAGRALRSPTTQGLAPEWQRFDLPFFLEADRSSGLLQVASDYRWLQNDPRAQVGDHWHAVALRSWMDSPSQGSLARSVPDLADRVRKVLKARPEWTAFFLKIATHTLGLGADAARRGEHRGPCPLCLPAASRVDDAGHLLSCGAVQVAVSPGFPPEVVSWATDSALSLPDRLGLFSEAGLSLLRSRGCRGTSAFALLCAHYAYCCYSARSRLAPLKPLSFPLRA